jgi:hypothetical protein
VALTHCSFQDVLKPFLLACEKNSRLASLALSSIQKFLANDAVSGDGRALIISALQSVSIYSLIAEATESNPCQSIPLQPALFDTVRNDLQVEKFSDEHVKLRMLQTALTLLQSTQFADDEVWAVFY